MKIAILTSGILPVPAVQGGAVENLTDMYLEYNNHNRLHDITVYSVAHEATTGHPALQSAVNHYRYIDTSSFFAKLHKRIHKAVNRQPYYHYSIEYYLRQALRHIQGQDYDIVIIENRPGYALQVARLTPARIVLHLHNDFLNSNVPQATAIYKCCSSIITVSHYIENQVRTIEPTDKKCHTVHNGLDIERFTIQHTNGTKRSQYGLGDDDFVVIFTGRLIPEKGIRELIKAMLLLKDYSRIRLLVLGSSFYANEQQDSAFINQLKEMAQTLGSRLVFTGYTPYDQVPGMLAMANVAALPSVWEEPFGMTCIEAMSMGLPVITTDKGGIKEVTTPQSAITLPVDDQLPQRIAEAILNLFQHPDRCRQMGEQARLVGHRFSKESYAMSFFQSLSL